jgi:hypothetical protein
MPQNAKRSPLERRPIRAHPRAENGTPDARSVLHVVADAEPAEVAQASRLLELAGAYTRQALAFPAEVEHLRTIVAETLLENAMLRLDVRRLSERVDALERQRGGA